MIKHYKNSLCQLQKIFEMLSIVQYKRNGYSSNRVAGIDSTTHSVHKLAKV